MDIYPDINPVFADLFVLLQWLIPLLWLLILVKSPQFKGLVGELLLFVSARLQLDDTVYRSIPNVLLPVAGGDIRIDEIIVSRYGIFLIESNTMQGRIYGGRQQDAWRHKLGLAVERFESPRRQGFRHVKEVAEVLGQPENIFFPVAVFVGDSVFRSEMPKNVVHGNGFIPYIRSKTEALLSAGEVQRVVRLIELSRRQPTRRDWLAFGKHLIGVGEEQATDKHCPRCGGAMVLHASQKFDEKGQQFWGCASFPECRGVLDVTQVTIPHSRSRLNARGSGFLPYERSPVIR